MRHSEAPVIPRKWKIRRLQVPDIVWDRHGGGTGVIYKPLWFASNGDLWCESPTFEALCNGIKDIIAWYGKRA
jgi:hypothetical protein